MGLTSTMIIREYIDKNITEFNRTILEKKDEYIGKLDSKNTDIILLPSGEEIVVGYADISITGSDRPKPQIRVFMDKTRASYQYAKENQKRFFLFTIFSKENEMAKNISNYDPHDYIVAIETNIDNETSRRDLRSMFDFLDDYIGEGKESDFVRCASGFHQSGIYQAAFIKIRENGIVKPDAFINYITYFDSRPYMNSIADSVCNEQKSDDTIIHNRIVFGAPGTGKSHRLEEDSQLFGGNMERVTFHPNYSYASFVGAYKPVMTKNEFDWLIDDDKKKVITVLQDRSMNAQEKYDLLYDKFKDKDLTRLPLLLGIYTDENFKTKKMDGTDAAGDNSVERNHGKAIRPYLNLQSQNSNREISYEYVPGPFMRTYAKALDNPEERFLLLIEEINRANVAAVFGDIFQLLDRKNGVSEYPIATSEDIKKYLLDNLECLKGKNIDELSSEDKKKYLEMRIPKNMYIWATMNSADQGVFPMDTAFKRRWEFEYISVNEPDQVTEIEKYVIPMCVNTEHSYYVNWNSLRTRINNILIDNCKINEDKLLGPFFISKSMLDDIKANKDEIDRILATDEASRIDGDNNILIEDHKKETSFMKAFESKVIMYLFEDVMKMRAEKIFVKHAQDKGKMIFSEICKTFEKDGEQIFGITDIDHI